MSEGHYSGQRLSYDGHLATVRYIGTVKHQKGDWLGVEWDEPSRGKHDGSHGGCRYFTCLSRHSTAGSFVRPSRPSDQPLSFLDALKKKYASHENTEAIGVGKEIRISGKTVEEVGFEKKGQELAVLENLKVAVLDGMCIAGLGCSPQEGDTVQEWNLPSVEAPGIDSQAMAITLLDLSRNLLEKWDDVASICHSMQALRTLKVDGNRLRDLNCTLYGKEILQSFHRVTELGLDNTLLLWDQIVELTASFGSLTTLSLASNGLGVENMLSDLRTFTLTTLDLSSNVFTSLAHITCLSSLPKLTTLLLRSNPLSELQSPAKFPALIKLDVAFTDIPNLASLDPLPTVFPSLTKLLTKSTPLMNHESASLHTIARLPGIIELNYEDITPEKRLNAELFYLGFVAKQLAEAPDRWNEKAILDEHPRYKALCELHGEPATVKKKADEDEAGTLRARVTEFTFYITDSDLTKAQQKARGIQNQTQPQRHEPYISPTEATNPTQKSEETIPSTSPEPKPQTPTPTLKLLKKTRLLPRTIDIYRLKGIVSTLFSIPFLSFKLIWETDEFDPAAGEDEGGWSVSEDESDEEELVRRKREGRDDRRGWVKREVELVDGTREVGFWVEGGEARVRIELC